MMGSKQAIGHEVSYLEQRSCDHLVEAFLVENFLSKLDRGDGYRPSAFTNLSEHAPFARKIRLTHNIQAKYPTILLRK